MKTLIYLLALSISVSASAKTFFCSESQDEEVDSWSLILTKKEAYISGPVVLIDPKEDSDLKLDQGPIIGRFPFGTYRGVHPNVNGIVELKLLYIDPIHSRPEFTMYVGTLSSQTMGGEKKSTIYCYGPKYGKNI